MKNKKVQNLELGTFLSSFSKTVRVIENLWTYYYKVSTLSIQRKNLETHLSLYLSPNYSYAVEFGFNVQWILDFKKNYYLHISIKSNVQGLGLWCLTPLTHYIRTSIKKMKGVDQGNLLTYYWKHTTQSIQQQKNTSKLEENNYILTHSAQSAN